MDFVGIDYSISSPGICIHKEDGSDLFVNLQRGKIPKKYLEVYEESEIRFYNLDKIPTNLPYGPTEVLKVKQAMYAASIIMTILGSETKRAMIAIEGFSYGGTGSRTLDLAGFQYILRQQLVEAGIVDDFNIFTPGEIKKFAIKGNASKEQMIEAYLKLDVDNELTRVMKHPVLAEANKFPKPIDDLVDAFFISRLLKENFSRK